MNNKKLRIAEVTNLAESIPPKHKAGLEQMVYYLTEELVKCGHDVTLFATADSKTSANLYPLWPIGLSNDKDFPIRSPETFSVWAISETFLHADEFDIIHDHTYYTAGHFCQLIQTPVVSTIHHDIARDIYSRNEIFKEPYRKYHQLFKMHSNKLNRVVVSNFQRHELEKHLRQPATTIHNGIPLDIWSQYKETPGDYFAFLGYISGNKGVAEAIQAILKTDEKLIIAGPIDIHDERSREYFEKQIEPYIDGNQIEYIGPIGMDKKIEFLMNAKATLMPIQWDEPFGLVAIESLATGTPVIAWNRAAMPEIIEDSVSGFLVNSVEEMTNRIQDIEQINRRNCRQRVENNFSAKKMASEYESLFYKILNQ